MTTHKNWRRAQMVVDKVNAWERRRLGRVQEAVLRCLLEMGTFPGTWHYRNASTTIKTLEALHRRNLVTVQEVDRTDWRGNPQDGKTKFWMPTKWMRDAMDAPSNEAALTLLEDDLLRRGGVR